ncbi:IucA/IucC family protein [Frankia sp. AiPa1]|uniref:IucA/IucC family protein n=1 Tax=Frankia sp. AiPa1 TaxID=573492 RepID=UPI0027E4451D|nr:IucA/IucC family protein [Frankia sp. AiPa1]
MWGRVFFFFISHARGVGGGGGPPAGGGGGGPPPATGAEPERLALVRTLTSLYTGLTPGPARAGAARTPPGFVPVPVHPWQAHELLADPHGPVGALLAEGRLIDLGDGGSHWYPTSSVRTVWRPDSPVMLKLSLGLRITNSRRVLQLGELRLAERITRLIDAGLGPALAARHPYFRLIGEPRWVAVTRPHHHRPRGSGRASATARTDGRNAMSDAPQRQEHGHHAEDTVGLEVALRTNPFGPLDRVACASSLIAARPDRAADHRGRARAAMLPTMLLSLSDRCHEPLGALAEAWFCRYLEVLAAPVLDLYLQHGVGVEAHLQNTLVSLDDDGWPVAGWYRDSQGYYVGESAVDATQRLLPGFATGLDLVFPDSLVIDRLIYYLFVNNVFAIAGALGAADVANEHRLLGRVRTLLWQADRSARADQTEHRPPAARRQLLSILLDAANLPSKGNLRTLVDGRDELISPVATQSVYVQIPNPLLEVVA